MAEVDRYPSWPVERIRLGSGVAGRRAGDSDHAPLGPDLIDYLSRVTRYTRRPRQATDWRLHVHAGPDFLDWMRREGIVNLTGRGRLSPAPLGLSGAA